MRPLALAGGLLFLRLDKLWGLWYSTFMENENNEEENENQNQERISQLVKRVHEAMEDLGLYSLNYSIGTSDPSLVSDEGSMTHDVRELIESGNASFVLSATFRLNEMAWTDRILHPEKFDLDKQFRKMMPSDAEMEVERLKGKMEGGDVLAIFDDDEELDDEA